MPKGRYRIQKSPNNVHQPPAGRANKNGEVVLRWEEYERCTSRALEFEELRDAWINNKDRIRKCTMCGIVMCQHCVWAEPASGQEGAVLCQECWENIHRGCWLCGKLGPTKCMVDDEVVDCPIVTSIHFRVSKTKRTGKKRVFRQLMRQICGAKKSGIANAAHKHKILTFPGWFTRLCCTWEANTSPNTNKGEEILLSRWRIC